MTLTLERLDLLIASKEAGHTGVRNELVGICDELKRQCIIDSSSYKKKLSLLFDAEKKLVTKALKLKSKKILQKYTEPSEPATQDINAVINGSTIAIQDLVKKLNNGVGIKVVKKENDLS